MRRRRLVRYLVLLVVVLGLIALYWQRQALLAKAEGQLAQVLSDLIGERVLIGEIDADFFELALTAKNLRVLHSKSSDELPSTEELTSSDALSSLDEHPLLEVESLHIKLSSDSSLEHIRISTLQITGPSLHLELDNGKLVHFPGIRKRLETSESSTQSEEPGTRVDIPEMWIRGANLTILDRSAGWSAEVHGLSSDLSLQDGLPSELSLTLNGAELQWKELRESIEYLRVGGSLLGKKGRLKDLFLKIPSGELQASGTFNLGAGQEDTKADLRVEASAELGIIGRYLSSSPSLEGAVSVEGDFHVGESYHASGQVKFRDVVIDKYVVGQGSAQATIDPERLSVERLDLPLGQGRIQLSGELGLDKHLPLKAAFELQDIQLAELFENLSLDDPWVMATLDGAGSAEGFLLDPLQLSAQVGLKGRNLGVWGHSFHQATDETRIMGIHTIDVSGEANIDPDGVSVQTVSLETPHSRAFVDGRINFDQSLDLSFDAVDLDVSEMSPLAGFEMAGRGWGKGRIKGPFRSLAISADMDLFSAHFDEYELGDVSGWFFAPLSSSDYLSQRFALHERSSSAASTSDIGEFSQDIPVTQESPASDSTAAELVTVVRSSAAEGPYFRRVTESASLRALVGSLDRVDKRYYGGDLAASSPPVLFLPSISTRMGRTRVHGSGAIIFGPEVSVYAKLELPAGDDGALPQGTLADVLTIPEVLLEDDPLNGHLSGRIEVMGDPLALDGQGEFSLRSGEFYGQSVQSADATLALEGGDLLIQQLNLGTRTGRLTTSGRIGREGALEGTLQLEQLPLGEVDLLKDSGLEGVASGLIVLADSLEHPRIQGQLSLENSSYHGVALGDSVLTMTTEGEKLAAEGLLLGEYGELHAEVGLFGNMPYLLEASLDTFRVDPYLEPDPDADETIEIEVGGNAKLRGWLSGEASPHLEASLTRVAAQQGDLGVKNGGPISLEIKDGRVLLAPLDLVGMGTRVSAQGQVEADGRVAIELGGEANLAVLKMLLPDIFQRIEGSVTFGEASSAGKSEPFHIGGTLSALQFEGKARVSDGAIRSVFFDPTIDEIAAQVEVGNNNEIVIRKLTGSLGGGTVDGQGVLVLGADYYPNHYDLKLDAHDSFVHYPSFLPPGLMDASLRFNGEVGSLLMSGDVWLKRMVYRERYNWEMYLTDFRTYRLEDVEASVDSEPYFDIDIRIHSPGTFFIRNNIGSAQLKGELRLVGDTNAMELFGNIESERGTLTILENTFDLTEGTIEFTGDYWNPNVDVRMQTEIQSYTIYYHVTGTLEDWRLTPGSDSGLSERDINSLIAFGTLADNITGGEARALAAPTLEFLVGRFGSGLLEPLQAFARLDRFTIIPAPDESGNLGVRVYGEKELVQNKLFASGYYDYALDGNQEFLTDIEWRTFDCCSTILRLESEQIETTSPLNPGLRFKLKLEFE